MSNVHDEMRRFISYIYAVINVNLRSPSIGGLRKQVLEASQEESALVSSDPEAEEIQIISMTL